MVVLSPLLRVDWKFYISWNKQKNPEQGQRDDFLRVN